MAGIPLAYSVSQHTPVDSWLCRRSEKILESTARISTDIWIPDFVCKFAQASGITDAEHQQMLLAEWMVPGFITVFRRSRKCLGEVTALSVQENPEVPPPSYAKTYFPI